MSIDQNVSKENLPLCAWTHPLSPSLTFPSLTTKHFVWNFDLQLQPSAASLDAPPKINRCSENHSSWWVHVNPLFFSELLDPALDSFRFCCVCYPQTYLPHRDEGRRVMETLLVGCHSSCWLGGVTGWTTGWTTGLACRMWVTWRNCAVLPQSGVVRWPGHAVVEHQKYPQAAQRSCWHGDSGNFRILTACRGWQSSRWGSLWAGAGFEPVLLLELK